MYSVQVICKLVYAKALIMKKLLIILLSIFIYLPLSSQTFEPAPSDKAVVYFVRTVKGGFGSLEEVMLLFKNPKAVLAGWIHYLVFDLLTGRWIALEAIKNGISKWYIGPCLLFTLMLGPVGFLLFTILKYFHLKKN